MATWSSRVEHPDPGNENSTSQLRSMEARMLSLTKEKSYAH